MAQKSKPRTPRKSSYRGFEGVDLKKTHSGDESVALIDNFRITDDGSLKKRYGFKNVYSYTDTSQKIKASYSIIENGVEMCYFTQDKFVKKYNSKTQTVTSIGELSRSDSNIFFFEYLNNLYVCDGSKMFTVNSSSLSDTTFYIPLYGKDWNAFAGAVNEAPNLLWPKVAITYKLTPPSTSYLSLGNLKIASIDALYRNGTLLTADKYYINERYNSITVPEFADNDVFLAILTFTPDQSYENQRNALFASSNTSIFYELNKNNLFFWGNDNSNQIFYTLSINEDNAKETDKYVTNVRFYVPTDSYFTVGSSKDRINAFIRHYDRTLIMTGTSTWITNLEDIGNKNLKIRNINSSIGCVIKNGCVRIENTLFSVGKDAIYAWNADTDELNECNAHSISDPIHDLLCKDFFENCLMHLHYSKREIWFFSPNQGQTWIYNFKRKAWYAFSGFYPTVFLSDGNEISFFDGTTMHVFDPSLTSDIYKGIRKNIIARFKSGELEFNDRRKKKLASTTIRGSFSGGRLTLQTVLDKLKTSEYNVSPLKKHSVISYRIRSGSFSCMTFELITSGAGEQIIHGIELDAD